jgi:hypothetical protein
MGHAKLVAVSTGATPTAKTAPMPNKTSTASHARNGKAMGKPLVFMMIPFFGLNKNKTLRQPVQAIPAINGMDGQTAVVETGSGRV